MLTMPGATPEKVERLLNELWEQTFLLTELRPPLTHPSPARHVAACLARVASAGEERVALDAVLHAMDAWDQLPIAQRPDAYRTLGRLAAAAVPDFENTPAQVDTALALDGRKHHKSVAREAANAAELLLRLNPSAGGLGQLDSYRHAFIGRYGIDREIPLVEVLDRDHGLGPPAGYGSTGVGIDQAKLAMRDQTLRELAVDALRDRRLAVALDRDTLDGLSLTSPTAETAPVSLDIAVFVLAGSAAAIDAGEFETLMRQNLAPRRPDVTSGASVTCSATQAGRRWPPSRRRTRASIRTTWRPSSSICLAAAARRTSRSDRRSTPMRSRSARCRASPCGMRYRCRKC